MEASLTEDFGSEWAGKRGPVTTTSLTNISTGTTASISTSQPSPSPRTVRVRSIKGAGLQLLGGQCPPAPPPSGIPQEQILTHA